MPAIRTVVSHSPPLSDPATKWGPTRTDPAVSAEAAYAVESAPALSRYVARPARLPHSPWTAGGGPSQVTRREAARSGSGTDRNPEPAPKSNVRKPRPAI